MPNVYQHIQRLTVVLGVVVLVLAVGCGDQTQVPLAPENEQPAAVQNNGEPFTISFAPQTPDGQFLPRATKKGGKRVKKNGNKLFKHDKKDHLTVKFDKYFEDDFKAEKEGLKDLHKQEKEDLKAKKETMDKDDYKREEKDLKERQKLEEKALKDNFELLRKSGALVKEMHFEVVKGELNGDVNISMDCTAGYSILDVSIEFNPDGLEFNTSATLIIVLEGAMPQAQIDALTGYHIHGCTVSEITVGVDVDGDKETTLVIAVPGFSRYSLGGDDR